jgi:hypothetical protein
MLDYSILLPLGLSEKDPRETVSGCAVHDFSNTFLTRAMRAAEQNAVFVFRSVAENAAATVIARGCQGMYCALKTVEYMGIAPEGYLKCLVVIIPTHFTYFQGLTHTSSFWGWPVAIQA